jgi:hypothetical protein
MLGEAELVLQREGLPLPDAEELGLAQAEAVLTELPLPPPEAEKRREARTDPEPLPEPLLPLLPETERVGARLLLMLPVLQPVAESCRGEPLGELLAELELKGEAEKLAVGHAQGVALPDAEPQAEPLAEREPPPPPPSAAPPPPKLPEGDTVREAEGLLAAEALLAPGDAEALTEQDTLPVTELCRLLLRLLPADVLPEAEREAEGLSVWEAEPELLRLALLLLLSVPEPQGVPLPDQLRLAEGEAEAEAAEEAETEEQGLRETVAELEPEPSTDTDPLPEMLEQKLTLLVAQEEGLPPAACVEEPQTPEAEGVALKTAEAVPLPLWLLELVTQRVAEGLLQLLTVRELLRLPGRLREPEWLELGLPE